MIINIADPCCKVSTANKPIGHEKKSIDQAVNLFGGSCIVTIGKEYDDHYPCKVHNILKCITENDGIIKKTFWELKNLIVIESLKEADIIWLIYVDFVVLLFLSIRGNKKRYLLTTFRNWEAKFKKDKHFCRIRTAIYHRAINNSELIIYTDPSANVGKNGVHLPDYYLEKKYCVYRNVKKEGCVLLGIMSESKHIVEIAKVFAMTNVQLKIIG